MPVKQCVISGSEVTSLEDLYDVLEEGLSLPEYFGRNLDALWDVLSTDIEGPFEIVWEDSEASRMAMGEDFDRIAALFDDLGDERDDFEIVYR